MRNELITDSDGSQRWYKDNKLHRDDDLPAMIYANGSQFWFIDGLLHRENGPAAIHVAGDIFWALKNQLYSFDYWCLELNKTPKEKAFLALKYL